MKRDFKLNSVIITVNDADKNEAIKIGRKLAAKNVKIYATPGTYNAMKILYVLLFCICLPALFPELCC